LEGGWAVSHAKEHYQGFEQASIGLEGYFPLISRLNADIVETPMNVQLGEVSGSTELQYEFGDQWEGVLILDRHGIECSVVLNQPEEAVLFLDEEYRGCHGRFRGTNLSGVTPLENFLWKYSMGNTLYLWISLLESTLETSYKPQT